VAALKLTFGASALVVLVNAVFGTLIAWVLVRDEFRGKSVVNAIIDLPFALPTIVAGLVLLAVYGPRSPIDLNLAYTRAAVVLALLFVTLPFVVRAVQPVLLELDREMEEAAASLGASSLTSFRRIVLPNLMPAILSGAALSFGKAVGEFGSVVLISGNIPFDTEVSSVHIFKAIESDDQCGASTRPTRCSCPSSSAVSTAAAMRGSQWRIPVSTRIPRDSSSAARVSSVIALRGDGPSESSIPSAR